MVGSQAASLNSTIDTLRTDAIAIVRAAVAALDPFSLTRSALHQDFGVLRECPRVGLVAAGKAAWPMAEAAAEFLKGRISTGVITGVRRNQAPPRFVEFIPGSHPLPDDASVRAAARAMDIARTVSADGGVLLALLSGGASAMLARPAHGITLDDKRQTIDVLSRSGTPIHDLNCVRKHLSAVKGGRLAAAANGRCTTLAISDVHEPPDDPGTIGSGPTVADPTTFDDALRVIDSSRGAIPAAVRRHFARGAAGEISETVKPGDPAIASATFKVIANRYTAMEAAVRFAAARGYHVQVLDAAVVGEAVAAGRVFAETAVAQLPGSTRACVIASGETTVVVRGSGRGGRNQEFVLGAAKVLARERAVAIVCSVGTDGIDGPTDAAGGIVTGATAAAARERGLDVNHALAENDAYPVLAALDALVKTGPTFTNVGDLHVFLRSSLG